MKKLLCIISAAALLLSAAACSAGSKGGYPVKIAAYTVSEKPESVVCLSDSIADILITCGYADSIKARSDECTQQELADVPTVGSKSGPSLQRIESVSPQIVFTDNTVSDDIAGKLSADKVTVMKMLTAQNGDDLKVLYSSLGAVMGGNDTGRTNGQKKASNLLITLDDLQRLIPKTDVPVTACYLYDTEGGAVNNNTFAGRLFEYANLVNICANYSNPQDVLNAVKRDDPKYIFCPVGVREKILSDKNFRNVSAVKSGNVYEIDENLFVRQGDSMTEVLSYMIETVYPELKGNSADDSKQESKPAEESKPESKPAEESKQESKPESKPAEESKQESKPESKPAEESKQESKPAEESKPESSQITVTADDSLVINDDTAFGRSDVNDDIMKLQKRLKDLGYGEFPDGFTDTYGGQTEAAVIAFKNNNGFGSDNPEDTSGYLDADMLRLLFSDKVKPAQQQPDAQ